MDFPKCGLWFCLCAVLTTGVCHAEGPADEDGQEMSNPMDRIQVKNGAWVIPDDVDLSQPVWRAAMDAHRARQRALAPPIHRPETLKRAFVEGFAFVFDRRLYDAGTRRWRIDEFLDRGEKEFGGYDQVILWQSYPRLGIGPRNQFDYYRDMPGGLKAVNEWVRRCHRRGVRLFLTYNPWDLHTREGDRHTRDLLEALKATGADGVYLDTLAEPPAEWDKAFTPLGREVLYGTEGHPWDKRLARVHTSWGQGWAISPPDRIYNTRWLWPEHKTFLTSHRHRRDHWDEVCSAWFAGTGVLVWEVVFGNDTSWVERDKRLLRAIKPLQVAFWENFAHPDWQPHIPSGSKALKVNSWPGPLGTVYTLSWPQPRPYDGPLFAAEGGKAHIDLFTGTELPVVEGMVRGRIGVRSIGGVLAVEKVTPKLRALLKKVCPGQVPPFRAVNADRIPAADKVDHRLRRVNRFRGVKPQVLPAGMVWVPGGTFTMKIKHRWHGATCYGHYGWDKAGRKVELTGFAVDAMPVTNARFAEFLRASGYVPEVRENFLKHWTGGEVPPPLADHPVVYVSLGDARAYAKWAGKRLPTEAEWQYAAQGDDGRRWPWSRQFAASRVNATGGTVPVGSIAKDASPFGLRDLCGHVWQWTDDTYTDRVHTFAIIKGGSFFRMPADASKWYVHTGPLALTSHAKVPLVGPSLDRFATVGFRCVMD